MLEIEEGLRILAPMLVLALPFTALILFYVGYLLRCAWHFARLQPTQSVPETWPMVSVIIPARNEADRVGKCVRAVLAQDYPQDRLELIVVNDHSEDTTVIEATSAAGDDPRLEVLNLSTTTGSAYKKAAVAMGIAQSRGEIIITTDADCHMGSGWLRAMVGSFDLDTDMVSGPVCLEGEGAFEQMQVLEFMGLVAVGAAGIAAGNPNMCNGANLAYRKSAFIAVGGFAGIDHIASGDDELLMHKIAAHGSGKVKFAKSKDAIVRTHAQPTWQALKQQRIRWVSKSTHYQRKAITLTLVFSYLAMLGFPTLAIAGIWDHRLWFLVAAHLLLKMMGELAVLAQSAIFFDNLRLLAWLPVEQVAHIAYVLWVGLAGRRRSYQWKGRIVQ